MKGQRKHQKKKAPSYLAMTTSAVSAFNPGRLVFFSVHSTLHLFLYVLPRFFFHLYILWPLSVAEYIFLRTLAPWILPEAEVARWSKARAERRHKPRWVKIVTHPQHYGTLHAFGLHESQLYRTYLETVHDDTLDEGPTSPSFLSCRSVDSVVSTPATTTMGTVVGREGASTASALSVATRSRTATPAPKSAFTSSGHKTTFSAVNLTAEEVTDPISAGVHHNNNGAEALTFAPLEYKGPLYEGNLHTIMGSLRSFDFLTYQREVVRSFDGNPICLDYLFPETERQRELRLRHRASPSLLKSRRRRRRNIKALVVILPGLTGTSREFYVQRMVKALYNVNQSAGTASGSHTPRKEYNNIQVVVLNARGVGDTPLEQPQIFSALFTKDLRHVLEHDLTRDKVRDRFGLKHDIPIIGLAFSLGGLILANYCGEEGLRAMRAQGLHPDDQNTTRYPPDPHLNPRDADGNILYHYGAGRQPYPLSENGTAASSSSGSSSASPNVLDAAITVTSPHNLIDGDAAMNTLVTRSIYGNVFYRNLFSYYDRHKEVIQRLPGIQNRESLFVGLPVTTSAEGPSSDGKGGRQREADRGHEDGGGAAVRNDSTPKTVAARRNGGVGTTHSAAAAAAADSSQKKNEGASVPRRTTEKRSAPLISSLTTVRDFDNHITGPHFGFDSCFAYYNWADNFKKFPFSLKTKLMCVVAVNDPICGPPQPFARYEEAAVQLEANRQQLNLALAAAAATKQQQQQQQQQPSSFLQPASASNNRDPSVHPLRPANDNGASNGVPNKEPSNGMGDGTVADSMSLHLENDSNDGGFVYVEFPVGGHLGFLGSPVDELFGKPNEMERFVAKSLEAAIRNWYAEKGLSVEYMNDNHDRSHGTGHGKPGGTTCSEEDEEEEDDSDWDGESFSNAGR